jgi:hypothetical protein
MRRKPKLGFRPDWMDSAVSPMKHPYQQSPQGIPSGRGIGITSATPSLTLVAFRRASLLTPTIADPSRTSKSSSLSATGALRRLQPSVLFPKGFGPDRAGYARALPSLNTYGGISASWMQNLWKTRIILELQCEKICELSVNLRRILLKSGLEGAC